ncbi:hypothetical protein [Tenacibaculum sp. nBUS_03]|uniref:hypothetical protein n=1 Tax=Tenacibaculum sp. nBUS_03 TaxID=3395320 RepID=UPI003EBB9294
MKFLKVLLFFTLTNVAVSQNSSQKPAINSIKKQFETLYKKSGSYQKYKVIEKTLFNALQRRTVDTIKNLKSTIASKQDLINIQNKKLVSLENQISSLNDNLTKSSEKEDQISFLGVNLTKSNYNLIVWGIIFITLSLLIYFIYRFKNSNIITKDTLNSFDEIEQEFEQYKKKTIEKEQQLRRKLQDEINKQRGV